LLTQIPTRIETERLVLRCYQAGDGAWYYAMSQKNKPHLARYESGNAVMTIDTEEEAELVVCDFAAAWTARTAFFMGAFRRDTQAFVAQIYIGVVNWDLPEMAWWSQPGFHTWRYYAGFGEVLRLPVFDRHAQAWHPEPAAALRARGG